MKFFQLFLLFVLYSLFFLSCDKNKKENGGNSNNPTDTTTIKGFSLLNKLPGIWNGSVTSTTALGSYPEWIVDFRPISAMQVSGKSELDTLNDIFMSFFVTKYDNKYQMAFRNGGGFAGLRRVAYMLIDSVHETGSESFYRFSDVKAGRERVYTDVLFKSDSIIIKTYTSKYNTVSPAILHMQWRAQLKDTTSAQSAATLFSYPQKQLARDLSTSFTGLSETVFYNNSNDPYLENEQPYLGHLMLNIAMSSNITPDPAKKTFVLITTQPLFNGFTFNAANIKYRSRYVVLAADDMQYTFNYLHPGSYYLYVLYDVDGNRTFSSGDYISSNLNQSFTLGVKESKIVSITIDFQIP